ncbi:MAG: CDP-glycerol glycerophosphotransferase family protein [Eubacterium sp.]|nr:CDP-glycerol glycerophosphotransferase family protein [Eubacterium sp.]
MIYETLSKIYHKFSSHPLIEKMGDQYLQGFPWDLQAARRRMQRQLKVRDTAHAAIRIVFLLQDPFNWNVMRPVYEAAKKADGFEVDLVAVPYEVTDGGDETYRMLVELYGTGEVLRADTKDGWLDLKILRPDYVFLPQPYDQYLPKCYRSHVISEYARICFMPYGFVMIHNTVSVGLNGRFCRNVAIFFADNPYTVHLQKDRYPANHADGIQKTVSVGYPPLVEFAHLEKTRHRDLLTIGWTPRWNEDPALGGSSFLMMKDKIPAYVEQHPETALIFRPHPFLFRHFTETGKITEQESKEYIQRIEENGRMEYDTNPEYKPAFAEADVLVSDISSILISWIVTGKPLIYCKASAVFNEYIQPLTEGMYIAGSWEEVENYLDMLRRGEDPLKKKREELLQSGIVVFDSETPQRILQVVEDDYRQGQN